MTKIAEPKRSGTAETLQHALNEAVGNLPACFLNTRFPKS